MPPMFPGMGLEQLVKAQLFNRGYYNPGGDGQLLHFFTPDPNPSTVSQRWLYPGGARSGLSSTSVRIFYRAWRDGIIEGMRVRSLSAGAGSGNTTYRIEINNVGVEELVIANNANPHEGGIETEIAVNAADKISIEMDWDVVPTTKPLEISASLLFRPDNSGRGANIPFGGTIIGSVNTITYLWPFLGARVSGAVGYDPTERFIVIPGPLTITSMRVITVNQGSLNGGTPVTGTYTLRKNGADTSLSLVIEKDTDATAWAGEQSGEVSFDAGDRMSVSHIYNPSFNGVPNGISFMMVGEIT